MARILTDETFNRLVVMLAKDEKVALFNALCTAPKTGDDAPAAAPGAERAEPAESGKGAS